MQKKIKVLRSTSCFELRRVIEPGKRKNREKRYFQIAARGGTGVWNYGKFKTALHTFNFFSF